MIRFTHKSFKQFCTKPFLTIVQEAQNKNTQSNQDSFQNQLQKVLQFDQENVQLHNELDRNLISASINSQTPIKSILQTFEIFNKRGFDEDLLAKVCDHLGKTFIIHSKNQRIYKDLNQQELFENWRFQDLIQEISFGLRSEQFVSESNLEKITSCLANIGYHDTELLQSLFKKLQQFFSNKNFENINQTQGHKPYYYNINEKIVDIKQQIQQILTQELGNDNDETVQTIDEVKSILKDNYTYLHNKVNAIKAIRQHYVTILNAQKNLDNLKQDHALNLQLLDLEEKLLQNEFISFDDIKNPNNLIDNDKNNLRISKILENYMKSHFVDYEAYMFYHSMSQQLKTQQEKKSYIQDNFDSKNNIDYGSISKIIHNLSIITLNSFETDAQFFEDYQSIQKTHDQIMQIQKKIESINQKKLNQNPLYLASANANLGQGEQSRTYLEQFLSHCDLQHLTPQESQIFVQTLMKIPQFKSTKFDEQKNLFFYSQFDKSSLQTKAYLLLMAQDQDIEIHTQQKIQFYDHILENYDNLISGSDWKLLETLSLVNLSITLDQNTKLLLQQLPNIQMKPQSNQKKMIQQILNQLQNQDYLIKKFNQEKIIKNQINFINQQKTLIIKDTTLINELYLSYYDQIQQKIFNQQLKQDVQIVPIMKFLQQTNQQIQWKPQENVMEQFTQILSQKNLFEKLDNIITIFLPILDAKLNFKNTQLLYLFGQNFNQIQKLKKNINQYTLQNIKQQLYKLNKLYKSLDQNIQSLIDELVQKTYQKNFYDFLQEQKTEINLFMNENLDKIDSNWLGKRLSCSMINNNQGYFQIKEFDPKIILNQQFVNDQNYVQYNGDHTLLEKITYNNLGQIELKNNAILSNKKYLYINRVMNILPVGKLVNMIRPISVKLGGQEFLASQYQKSLDNQTEFLINILNLKYELKQNPELLFKILKDCEFVENLIDLKDDENNLSSLGLNRKSEDYFNYLEQLSKQQPKQLLDESLKNLSQKSNQVEYLKQLKENKLKQLYKQVQSGKISQEKFDEFQQKVNQALTQTLEEISQDNQQNNFVSYDAPTMAEYHHQSLQNQQQKYFKELDQVNLQFQSVIQANGDYDQALEHEKWIAQQKLIKARIILKKSNDIQLSSNEQNYIKNWNNQKYQKSTQMGIGYLNQNDQSIFQESKLSNITKFKKLRLNEVILELSHFISNEYLEHFDLQFANNEWSIGQDNFQFDQSYQIAKFENDLFTQNQKMSQYELDSLKQLLKINRSESPFLKQVQEKYEEKVFPFLDKANLFSNRFQVMNEYIKVTEEEIKKDQFILKIQNQNEKKIIDEIWQKSFSKGYLEVSSEEISKYIHEFQNRLYLLSLSPCSLLGPFLISLINHPQIQQVEKDKLLGIMEIYDLTPKFTSFQMEQILESYVDEHEQIDLQKLTESSSIQI